MVICSRQTAHKLNTNIRNLVMVLTKKRGKNKHTCPMFDNEFLDSPKKTTMSQISYYPYCFMSIGLMLDDIIMNLISDITKKTTDSVKKDLFSKIQDDKIYLYKGSMQDYLGKNELLIQKRHYFQMISLKKRNQENIYLVSYLYILMRLIYTRKQICSSMILATLITNI